ncbi:major facilitator superfamily domain-containing protein [Suillus paluster]|uniref:major facilitator superfamily domain-containing protein n=1 Tax=Suillus paluster TaxID=48578 RepID=UPI001B85DF2D|nr:major facilitator superfamily domain-containing protein [Suillus paluster]KAG1751642.1 major facilitator superfamily domain-containing protein [Suillus paluster]
MLSSVKYTDRPFSGAIFCWPSAKFETYGGFVGSIFVTGCGLSTLEVAANSYVTVLGTPQYAAARLNFSHGFQAIATFAGPLIASRWFFTGANATSLGTVQWVYLAVAGLGVALLILFFFCDLPEITEDMLDEEIDEVGIVYGPGPLWKQYHCVFAFVAQTAYYGAQVSVASFAVNFLVDQGLGIHQSKASQLLSFCQITFTIARFIGVAILNFIDPALLLAFYGFCCSLFCLLVSQLPGYGAVGCLFCLFFFESICYPCIFSLGTKNLGVQTKWGTSLIGVGGGAWYPPAQGALADKAYTRRSYLVPMSGFIAMTIYAVGIVIHQARKSGFTFRNRNELSAERAAATAGLSLTDPLLGDTKGRSNSEKKISSDELIAVA